MNGLDSRSGEFDWSPGECGRTNLGDEEKFCPSRLKLGDKTKPETFERSTGDSKTSSPSEPFPLRSKKRSSKVCPKLFGEMNEVRESSRVHPADVLFRAFVEVVAEIVPSEL